MASSQSAPARPVSTSAAARLGRHRLPGRLPDPTALDAGGYAEDVGVNEDAEFAIRMQRLGGVWFDPRDPLTYTPRSELRRSPASSTATGVARVDTRRHPQCGSRQLPRPPGPRPAERLAAEVALAYAAVVLVGTAREPANDPESLRRRLCLPVMHLCWGLGFLRGVLVPHAVAPASEVALVDGSLNGR